MLPLAVAAVLIALAFAFLLIALRTKNGALHPIPSSVRNAAKKPLNS